MKKLLEIIELCKKLSKSTTSEQLEDKLYKLIDGSISSVPRKTKPIEIEKIKLPEPPKLDNIDIPSGARGKNKISNSEI